LRVKWQKRAEASGRSRNIPFPPSLLDTLRTIAELGDFSLELTNLCRDVSDGLVDPDDRTLLKKMRDAIDGTLEDPERQQEEQASKKSSATKKKKAGRPSDTNHDADKQIWAAWKMKQFRTYEDFAQAKGMEERDVRLAVDRHEKRRRRGTTVPQTNPVNYN
jgi:hypothetical protein